MKYTQRLNAFKSRTTWEVTLDRLIWHNEKGENGEIPFNSIKSVRLRAEPSRAETRRVALHVYTPIDHVITNIDYKGPMTFKANTGAFRNFLIAFHDRFPPNTKTVFYKGSTRAVYIGNVLITLVVLAFLFFLAPLLALTGIPSAGSIVRIGIIILFVPIMLSLLVKNKPDTYTPDRLPLEMLKS